MSTSRGRESVRYIFRSYKSGMKGSVRCSNTLCYGAVAEFLFLSQVRCTLFVRNLDAARLRKVPPVGSRGKILRSLGWNLVRQASTLGFGHRAFGFGHQVTVCDGLERAFRRLKMEAKG
jgi:hypothetical protein